MSGSQQLLLGGSVQQGVDPFFYSVTSLLHGDGTNGGQNNTFLDSSSNNFTITRNGNTTQGSFSPFSQTGWGNYFDGTGDYLTIADNTALQPGGGAFTYEAWVYPLSYPGGGSFKTLWAQRANGSGYGGPCVVINSSGTLLYFVSNAATTNWQISGSSSGFTLPLNQWSHIAIVRNVNTCTIYLNGIAGTSVTLTENVGVSAALSLMAGAADGIQAVDGYMSNFRLVKGTAVYTSNFTPSTTPLTAISGTSLLTCQANRFLDASSNNFTITRNGDVSVQPFSPFNPITPYSTSAVGGSGYFDGSGDFLNFTASSVSTSADFTVECWIYPNASIPSNHGIFALSDARFGLITVSGNLYLLTTTGDISTSTALLVYQWNHVAVTRTSGVLRVFLNGSQVGPTQSNSQSLSGNWRIASNQAGEIFPACYITGARILIGTGGTSVPVPTAPLTAVANTNFLCNFTNGAIFDNAADADYETVGNAQISTSVKKYGTGSIAFDGNGDNLYAPSNLAYTFGSGDFTIEFWLYLNSVVSTQVIYDNRSANGAYPAIYMASASIRYYVNTADRIVGPDLSTSVWYHIAVSRVAGQTKMFVNGTQVGGTYADSTVYLQAPLRVGNDFTSGSYLNGYVDDLRISKGIGRYPYNFTPPTAEFPNIGGTVTLTADPYFDYTTLLLPGNGTNGAQNNTFLDSSTNNFTITRNGNTTQGTFSPFSQTGWGAYFDGSGDYCTLSSNASMDFGAGNFTIECWVYTGVFSISAGASRTIIGNSGNSYTMQLYIETGSGKVVFGNTGSTNLQGTNTVADNQWHHIVVVRSGTGSNQTALFVDGNRQAVGTNSQNYSSGTIYLGAFDTGNGFWNGYISNLRIVKGTAVYDPTQVTLTVPTSPLTAVSNTALLTFQSNRFLDNSTNAYTVTRVGDTSIQAFSPFNPTAAWSAATNGGSGYFDGSGDYLNGPSTGQFAPTGNFTISMWIYPTSFAAAYYVLAGSWNAGASDEWLIQYDNTGAIRFLTTTDSTFSAAGVIKLNQWQFLSISRTGNTLTGYVNGTSFRSYTLTGTVGSATKVVYIGAQQGTTWPYAGYMADFRLVAGSAESATPPTAPATAISGTNMLLNFTNAGIYDATSKNDLETVGNAQISTTQSKFGGSSMYFDGSGDYVIVGNSPENFTYGTGDFTIEMWIYWLSTSNHTLYDQRPGTTQGAYPTIDVISGQPIFYVSSANRIVGSTISTGQWYHLAISRYSGNTKMFLNGSQVGSTYADTNNYLSPGAGRPSLGSGFNYTSFFNGYIDDFRVTKGIARYTSNFTPPTTAFLTL